MRQLAWGGWPFSVWGWQLFRPFYCSGSTGETRGPAGTLPAFESQGGGDFVHQPAVGWDLLLTAGIASRWEGWWLAALLLVNVSPLPLVTRHLRCCR